MRNSVVGISHLIKGRQLIMGSVHCFLMFAEYARVKGWKDHLCTVPYTHPVLAYR